MAEGFQPFHVPQQSRRNKLRVHEEPLSTYQASAGLLPHYDSSLLTSGVHEFHHHNHSHGVIHEPRKPNPLRFGGSTSASSSSSPHCSRFDPLSSLAVNPSSIQNFNNNSSSNQFLYAHQNLRDLDQSFNGGDILSLTRDSTTTCQGLSLTLSSDHHRSQNKPPLELNRLRCDSVAVRGLGGDLPMPSDESRSVVPVPVPVPLGPFTGYASVLKRSRFLNPAQQLLDNFCGVDRGNYEERRCTDSSSMTGIGIGIGIGIVKDPLTCSDRIEHRLKNSRLISMLDEVYKRYKLYCQQMESVVASFETVDGLGNAAPYISFAFKAMSKHFRCLKNAILDQIQFTGKTLGDGSIGKDKTPRSWRADRGLHSQKPVQNSTFLQHPVWRSQRGLPLRAVLVLRTWLFEHFLHPYPTDSDKQMLAQQTGLSRSQVSNWFINARVRLWKPMVEEIHMLGTRQAQMPSEAENRNANMPTGRLPLANPEPLEKPPPTTPIWETQDNNELSHISEHGGEQVNLSYNNLSSNQHIDVNGSRIGGSSGISLALGLHQNNRTELSRPFPMTIAQHLGLQDTNSGVHLRNGF